MNKIEQSGHGLASGGGGGGKLSSPGGSIKVAKVAILYVCTGNYSVFFPGFYESSQRHLLKDHNKHYFVFTDDASLKNRYSKNSDISLIHKRRLGFPMDTLLRFEFFDSIKDKLIDFDYIYFFNANAYFLQDCGDEILPDEISHSGITVVEHAHFVGRIKRIFTYDNNPNSRAYLRRRNGYVYVTGAVNGGSSKAYLKMISELKARVQSDLDSKIIALWHDESHLNRYVYELDYKVKLLPPTYGYYQDCYSEVTPIRVPFLFVHHSYDFYDRRQIRVILLDKNKLRNIKLFRNSVLKDKSQFDILPLIEAERAYMNYLNNPNPRDRRILRILELKKRLFGEGWRKYFI